jgi:hypothetical protein
MANAAINFSLGPVLEADDAELFYALSLYLKSRYQKIKTDYRNYLYAQGTSSFCLMAHVDTVRSPQSSLSLKSIDDYIVNRNGVLGADDRAGIHAIVCLVESCRKRNRNLPSVIITNFEETGFRGIKRFIKDGALDKANLPSLFVNLDREGYREYVTYGFDLSDDAKYILSLFSIKHVVSNSCADNAFISDAYGVSSINMSIGYYNKHSEEEKLNVVHHKGMISLVNKLINIGILLEGK